MASFDDWWKVVQYDATEFINAHVDGFGDRINAVADFKKWLEDAHYEGEEFGVRQGFEDGYFEGIGEGYEFRKNFEGRRSL